MEIPVASSLCLFANGKRWIVDGAVFEKFLVHVLHLYNKLFAFVVLAIHIEDGATSINTVTKLFRVEVSDILNILFAMEHRVQEANKQFFVKLRAKQALKAEVGMWVDVFVYHSAAFYIYSQQIYSFFVNSQT